MISLIFPHSMPKSILVSVKGTCIIVRRERLVNQQSQDVGSIQKVGKGGGHVHPGALSQATISNSISCKGGILPINLHRLREYSRFVNKAKFLSTDKQCSTMIEFLCTGKCFMTQSCLSLVYDWHQKHD